MVDKPFYLFSQGVVVHRRRRVVTVAATQFPMTSSSSPSANRILAESLIRLAHDEGRADVILLPELFDGVYFCRDQDATNFDLAGSSDLDENALLSRFRDLSEELGVVLPVSFFERSNVAHYNSVAVFDCGRYLGVYRKSHIPGEIRPPYSWMMALGNVHAPFFFQNDLIWCAICHILSSDELFHPPSLPLINDVSLTLSVRVFRTHSRSHPRPYLDDARQTVPVTRRSSTSTPAIPASESSTRRTGR